MVFVLDIEVKHGEVDDESENAHEGFELSETLESEDQKRQQHLFLVHVETVQEERQGGQEQTEKEVLGGRVSH